MDTLFCLDYMTLTPGKIKARNPVPRDIYTIENHVRLKSS